MPTSGADQFRLSVVLSRDARTLLWQQGFEFSGRGHVKLFDGSSANRYTTDSARESGGLPKLQISWRRQDPRIGEIDIDYRSLDSFSHVASAANSDVRASGNVHYCLHVAKYGNRLVNWWDEDLGCRNSTVADNALGIPGWTQLGATYDTIDWVFDVPSADSLEVGRVLSVRQYRDLYYTTSRGDPIGRVDYGQCVALLERPVVENRIFWIRVQRVDCAVQPD